MPYKNTEKNRAVVRAWHAAHKDRVREIQRKWRAENPERLRELNSQSAKRHPETRRRSAKAYAKRHPDRVKARLEAWKERNVEHRKAYAQNPEVKARTRKNGAQWRKRSKKWNVTAALRKRLYAALNAVHTKKSKSVIDLIGCTPEYLIDHLERQFAKGMSWENRSKWHIDHIRPCAKYDLTDPAEQAACFHFTNLRPIWAYANRKKHDHITLLV